MQYAHFTTSEGKFTIQLYDQDAPKTVENFVGLATGAKEWTDPRTGRKSSAPYYNGTVFHRVIDGFMIQGGDPLGQGTGGPGYKFADEFHPKRRHDKAGVLSMANSGPNTNGGQFFVTLAPTPWLDNKHSVFGGDRGDGRGEEDRHHRHIETGRPTGETDHHRKRHYRKQITLKFQV